MATIYYDLYVADSTVAAGTDPSKTGLSPTWLSLILTGATQTSVISSAVITPVGGGHYQIAYDAETHGEAVGVLDAGSALTVNTDRFIPVSLTRDSSRIQAGISSTGNVVAASVTAPVTVGTNNDKTGYTLGSFGFTVTASSVTNPVTVGTNNDKTGYGLSTGERTTLATAILSDTTDTLGADLVAIKAVTDHLATGLQSSGGSNYQFTATALALAPTGSGGGGPSASAIASIVVADMATAPVGSVANLTSLVLDGGFVLASPTPTATTFSASGLPSGLVAGDLVGQSLIFQTGNRTGVRRTITGHIVVGSTHTFTLGTALGAAPATSDAFQIC